MTDDIELQNLWLALQKASWRVLAVVSATEKGSALDVANALADVGWQFQGEKTTILDLRDVKLRLVEYEKKRIEEHRANGETLVIALSSPAQSPASIALARAADAAVVLVTLGATSLKVAARAADEIGREKVLGAVIVRPKPAPKPRPVPAAPKIAVTTAPRASVLATAGAPAAAAAVSTQAMPARPSVGVATVKIAARARAKN